MKDDNDMYIKIATEIGDDVYDFFNMSERNDLIMVYELKEKRIYSYMYEDYLKSLNERSKKLLKQQYKDAVETGKIVLFIRDEKRKKLKSFTI